MMYLGWLRKTQRYLEPSTSKRASSERCAVDARLGALQEKRQWLQGLLVRKPEGVLNKEMQKASWLLS